MPLDPAKGLHGLWRVCEIGDTKENVHNWSDHCFALGKIYRAGRYGVDTDEQRGNAYIAKACDVGGNTAACALLARIHAEGASEGRSGYSSVVAEKLWNRTCSSDVAVGCWDKASYYLKQAEKGKNDQHRLDALKALKIGCEQSGANSGDSKRKCCNELASLLQENQ